MMSYINETDFVVENKKLVYPEIVTDGLQLYYDAKGKRDTDYHRDTILDMSGNKNHGKLHNFAYEKNSGYKDGLVFDYIDDKLVRPALDLKPDDFTFMLNGNIISFSTDGTVKRVQDGEVIESKGFNLVRDNNWQTNGATAFKKYEKYITTTKKQEGIRTGIRQTVPILYEEGNVIYCKVEVESLVENLELIQYNLRGAIKQGPIHYNRISQPDKNKTYTLESVYKVLDNTGDGETVVYIESGDASLDNIGEDTMRIKEMQVISLTATFGAGNEPTIEEIQSEPDKWQWLPNPLDLLESEEYKGNYLGDMENTIDGLYKTEVLSGEEIYTDEAEDNAGVHVDIDGKSVGGGSGKNLVELDLLEQQSTLRVKYPLGKLKPGIAYYVSFKNKDYTFWNGGGWVSEGPINDNIRSTGVVIRKGTGNSGAGEEYTVGELIKDGLFQIEEGSVATAYEPPAPTPDYPIEIHNLNDFDVVSSVGKRNLIALNNMEFGSFNYNTGINSTSNKFKRTINLIPVNPETKYYLWHNLTPKEGSNGIEIAWTFYRMDKTAIRGKNQYGQNTSIITPSNAHFIKIRFGLNQVSWDDDKYLLIKSSNTNSWVLAPEDNTESDNHPLIDKINLLLDEPLRSVGDVKDRLFRDSDGVWKVERNTSETEVLSVSLLYNAGTTETFTTFIFVPPMPSIGYQTSRCSHFINTSGQWDRPTFTHYSDHTSVNNRYFMVENKVLGVDSSDSHSIRLNKINNWLSNESSKGTPVTLVYKSGKPHIEILDQALQDKLNNLRSFEDSNYVYTVLPNEDNYLTDNLKPTLHAKFLYNNWYKEDRVINNLMIYNRALTNEEMLQNYKTIKRRWGM